MSHTTRDRVTFGPECWRDNHDTVLARIQSVLQLLITARDQGALMPTATNAGPTGGPIVPSVESVDV
jgi:hypothetical protein